MRIAPLGLPFAARPSLPTRHGRGAFTLMELIATIAIITMLATLGITMVSLGKAKARQTKCLGNVRQLGVGLSLFVTDFHVYPLWGNPGFAKGKYPEHHTTWIAALEKEELAGGKSQKWYYEGVWTCPAAPVKELSYGYNFFGLGSPAQTFGLGGKNEPDPDGSPLRPVGEGEVARPADMLAIGDGLISSPGAIRDTSGRIGRLPELKPEGNEDLVASTRRAKTRHRGRANVVFCDGHVEAIPLPTLFLDNAAENLKRWNRDNWPHRELLAP